MLYHEAYVPYFGFLNLFRGLNTAGFRYVICYILRLVSLILEFESALNTEEWGNNHTSENPLTSRLTDGGTN